MEQLWHQVILRTGIQKVQETGLISQISRLFFSKEVELSMARVANGGQNPAKRTRRM